MGWLLTNRLQPGDPVAKVPAKFYNDLDEILTNLDVFGGYIERDGRSWTIVPSADAPTNGRPADGYYIVLSGDSTGTYISYTDAFDGYDPSTDTDYSLEFGVTSSALDALDSTNPTGTTSTQFYDGDAATSTAQTYYRIPLVRSGKKVSSGGTFRENTFCAGSKGPIVELLKIT